ncbi:MAG: hypothetical protein ABSG43_01475 [Solirubrobacteraceae bacterium]
MTSSPGRSPSSAPRAGGERLLEQVADALARVGEQLVDVAAASQRSLLDLVAGAQQLPAGGMVADDPRVCAGVSGRWNPAGELVDPWAAAALLEDAALGELVSDGERVDRLLSHVQREHRVVDVACCSR